MTPLTEGEKGEAVALVVHLWPLPLLQAEERPHSPLSPLSYPQPCPQHHPLLCQAQWQGGRSYPLSRNHLYCHRKKAKMSCARPPLAALAVQG